MGDPVTGAVLGSVSNLGGAVSQGMQQRAAMQQQQQAMDQAYQMQSKQGLLEQTRYDQGQRRYDQQYQDYRRDVDSRQRLLMGIIGRLGGGNLGSLIRSGGL